MTVRWVSAYGFLPINIVKVAASTIWETCARPGSIPPLFDAILADAGITVVLSGVRMPG